jgi:HTH-type transcriptional regulator/antitoxin HigA
MQALLLNPIQSEEDYLSALGVVQQIHEAYISDEEIQHLWLQIEFYEQLHQIFSGLNPVQAIRLRMEQLGVKQKHLVDIIGSKSRVSEIMHRRRKLSLEHIRRLYKRLHIPLTILIQDYQLIDKKD